MTVGTASNGALVLSMGNRLSGSYIIINQNGIIIMESCSVRNAIVVVVNSLCCSDPFQVSII